MSIFKYSKIFLNKSLKKYVSGLIKRFINGINSAIEIDSHRDAKIERVNNDTYLKVFQNNLFPTPVMPSNRDVMVSELSLDFDHFLLN